MRIFTEHVVAAKKWFINLVPLGILTLLTLTILITSSPPGMAQEPDTQKAPAPAPFNPAETQHGFSEFDTIPLNPTEASPTPLPYYNDLPGLDPESQFPLDHKPKGLFLDITLAEGFDEDLEFRRGNLYYPVGPTDQFTVDASPVYVVFRVFKHYQAYQVIGQVFPDTVQGLPSDTLLDEDMAYLTLEDESGYLKFFPPTEQGWKPGRYHIDIFVGYEANAVSKMGTLQFHVTQNS
jgi:hypothetical protein